MNTEKLKEFRDTVYSNPDLFLTKQAQSRANEYAKDLEYADIVPIYLLEKKRDLSAWLMLNLGIQVNPNLGGCTVPCTCLDENGEPIPTALVFVVEETITELGFEGKDKDLVIRSAFVHELTHVKQLFKLGLQKFTESSFDTGSNSDRTGYVENALEKEAHAAQNKYLADNGIKHEFGIESQIFDLFY